MASFVQRDMASQADVVGSSQCARLARECDVGVSGFRLERWLLESAPPILCHRFMREEGYPEDEAAAKWGRDLMDTSIRRTVQDGETKLAVQGHLKYVFEQGAERSSAVASTETAATDEDAARMTKRARKQQYDSQDSAFKAVGGAFFVGGATSKAMGGDIQRGHSSRSRSGGRTTPNIGVDALLQWNAPAESDSDSAASDSPPRPGPSRLSRSADRTPCAKARVVDEVRSPTEASASTRSSPRAPSGAPPRGCIGRCHSGVSGTGGRLGANTGGGRHDQLAVGNDRGGLQGDEKIERERETIENKIITQLIPIISENGTRHAKLVRAITSNGISQGIDADELDYERQISTHGHNYT